MFFFLFCILITYFFDMHFVMYPIFGNDKGPQSGNEWVFGMDSCDYDHAEKKDKTKRKKKSKSIKSS